MDNRNHITTTGQGQLPRLLEGIGERPMATLEAHLDVHGPLPDLHGRDREWIVEMVERAGLRGHGGAAFPTGRKLRAVAARRGSKVVIANGTEGEPASKKDRVLLREAPHLVLDGAALAARAVRARRAIIAVSEPDQRSFESLEWALEQRDAATLRDQPKFELASVPDRYVAGHEAALVNLLNTGDPRPTYGARPFDRGVDGRPTLVQNVETLAHLALIARHGPDWFRELGTDTDPGSALVTVSGAVARPGVYEIGHGLPLTDLIATAAADDQLHAVLIGGYFGTWLTMEETDRALLSTTELSRYGAALGAGVVIALGAEACPVAECGRIADYFAAESAGQCGPCVHGLRAIASTVQRVATGTAEPRAHVDLERWATELPRRGACAHPDGAARFISSALRVFDAEFRNHARRGPCERCAARPVLPCPAPLRP
jgi:NADH:ubiquinone oxidoreductase subunit F (NADH-binding)